MMGRFLAVMVGLLAVFSALVANLYHLQIRQGGFYAAKAESQNRLAGFFNAERGSIYFTDRHGNRIPAVLNRDYPVVFAVPRQIQDAEGTAEAVAAILNLNESEKRELEGKLAKPGDAYERLTSKVHDEVAEKVKESAIRGIYVESEQFRFYPFETLAAHVLGFVAPTDKDDVVQGRYGIELGYDLRLRGRTGQSDGDNIVEPEDGDDVTLTIDRNIQAQAEELLSRLVEDHGATGGTIIVEEPATGKILTLANAPTFDPNRYGEFPIAHFLNPAVQSIYEPGSVFKVITMASGIDSGVVTKDSTFIDPGSLTLDGRRIENAGGKGYGTVTMTEIIEQSINTGAAFVGRKIGRESFLRYLGRFGFDAPTGIELPGEVRGKLSSLKAGAREVNLATVSFGQGVAVTPLELVSAISAIANGGVLMKPYLTSDSAPTAVGRVVSEEAAREVTEMMVSAVEKAGVARIPNYRVAGKTGTAQIPDFVRGGYTDKFIHTYVGFAPVADPKFVILVKLDQPLGAPLAGRTVVPAFRELAEFMLNYFLIPPDNLL